MQCPIYLPCVSCKLIQPRSRESIGEVDVAGVRRRESDAEFREEARPSGDGQ
jgi:hypothetical protein